MVLVLVLIFQYDIRRALLSFSRGRVARVGEMSIMKTNQQLFSISLPMPPMLFPRGETAL